MARDRKDKRYGRLSRSGHTSHDPRVPPADAAPTREYRTASPPPDDHRGDYRDTARYEDRREPPRSDAAGPQVRPRYDPRYRRPVEDDYPTEVRRDDDQAQREPSGHRDDQGYRDNQGYRDDRPQREPSGYRDTQDYRDDRAYRDAPSARRRLTEDDFPTQLHGYDSGPQYPTGRPHRARPADRDGRYRDDDFRDDAYRDDAYRDDARAGGAYGAGPYGERPYAGQPYRDERDDDGRASRADAGTGTDPNGQQIGAGGAALVIGKAAFNGTNRAARAVTNRVITASKARGAQESGLTSLIWNQVLSYGTDAMVTVALAGTVFFGASAHAQRGNVLLYLLITMAPFALIAPIIGPALDRLQHGRRWTMAATGVGRAVLALVMAAHPTDLLVLYPCALGSLVLSKAYGVVRAAAAPRLVPQGMTLTEANARLTIFGLGSTLVLGGVVGALIKVTGSYSAGLVLTAIGFAACAFFALSLPKQVDSAEPAPRHPEEPARPRTQQKVPPLNRLISWAQRGFAPNLVVALQGESALRLLSGLLTIYLAFYVESTAHGLTGVLQLAMVIGAAGVGNFLGTAIGTRVRLERPEAVVVASVCIAGAVCLLIALAFSPVVAAVGMLLASVGNALSKIALDALIQRDVVETLRASAFGKSETFLQLAWVVGAALGVVLPSSDGDGPLGFTVAGALVLAAGIVILLRSRAVGRLGRTTMTGATAHPDLRARADRPGSVTRRSVD